MKKYSAFTVKYEKRLPSDAIKKADKVFAAYSRKDINHRKTKSGKHFTLEIGLKHRAIRSINKTEWLVCSHETYNKELWNF